MTSIVPGVSPAPAAVLFDVDGTLAVATGDHMLVFAAEASATVGRTVSAQVIGERPHLDGTETSGWVDAQLARHVLGQDAPQSEIDGLLARYAARYRGALAAGTIYPGHAVPGVGEALESLARRGLALALSTGNVADVAHSKLEHLGLACWFDFSPAAGFGGRHPDRDAVAAAALAGLGLPSSAEVWLAGDTASDMRAARSAGVTAVGVLTGAAERAALLRAGAHLVLDSVLDLAEAALR